MESPLPLALQTLSRATGHLAFDVVADTVESHAADHGVPKKDYADRFDSAMMRRRSLESLEDRGSSEEAGSSTGSQRRRKRLTKRKARMIDSSNDARKEEERAALARYNVEGVHIKDCSVILEPLEDAEFSESESIELDSESREGGDSNSDPYEFTENEGEVEGPDREAIEEDLRQTIGRGLKRKAEDEVEAAPAAAGDGVEDDVCPTLELEASSDDDLGEDPETAFEKRASRMVHVTLKGVNIDANLAKQIEDIHPQLRREDIVEIFFSYFFFIQFDSPSARSEFAERLRQTPESEMECTPYCSGCAYVIESSVARHLEECKSDHNRDINKMCKAFQGLPAFKNSPEQTVLVVRRQRCVRKSELHSLLPKINNIKSVSFGESCIFELKSSKLAKHVSDLLDKSALRLPSHASGAAIEAPVVEAAVLDQEPGFNLSFGAKSKTFVDSVKGRELRGKDDVLRSLLILGPAMTSLTRTSATKYLHWLKILLGPKCVKIVTGKMESENYAVAFFASYDGVRHALKHCQLHFLHSNHVNLQTPEKFPEDVDPEDQPLRKKKKSKEKASDSQADEENRIQMEFSRETVEIPSEPVEDTGMDQFEGENAQDDFSEQAELDSSLSATAQSTCDNSADDSTLLTPSESPSSTTEHNSFPATSSDLPSQPVRPPLPSCSLCARELSPEDVGALSQPSLSEKVGPIRELIDRHLKRDSDELCSKCLALVTDVAEEMARKSAEMAGLANDLEQKKIENRELSTDLAAINRANEGVNASEEEKLKRKIQEAEDLADTIRRRKEEVEKLNSRLTFKQNSLENFYIKEMTVKIDQLDESNVNPHDLALLRGNAKKKQQPNDDKEKTSLQRALEESKEKGKSLEEELSAAKEEARRLHSVETTLIVERDMKANLMKEYEEEKNNSKRAAVELERAEQREKENEVVRSKEFEKQNEKLRSLASDYEQKLGTERRATEAAKQAQRQMLDELKELRHYKAVRESEDAKTQNVWNEEKAALTRSEAELRAKLEDCKRTIEEQKRSVAETEQKLTFAETECRSTSRKLEAREIEATNLRLTLVSPSKLTAMEQAMEQAKTKLSENECQHRAQVSRLNEQALRKDETIRALQKEDAEGKRALRKILTKSIASLDQDEASVKDLKRMAQAGSDGSLTGEQSLALLENALSALAASSSRSQSALRTLEHQHASEMSEMRKKQERSEAGNVENQRKSLSELEQNLDRTQKELSELKSRNVALTDQFEKSRRDLELAREQLKEYEVTIRVLRSMGSAPTAVPSPSSGHPAPPTASSLAVATASSAHPPPLAPARPPPHSRTLDSGSNSDPMNYSQRLVISTPSVPAVHPQMVNTAMEVSRPPPPPAYGVAAPIAGSQRGQQNGGHHHHIQSSQARSMHGLDADRNSVQMSNSQPRQYGHHEAQQPAIAYNGSAPPPVSSQASRQQEDLVQCPKYVSVELWRSLNSEIKAFCIDAYDGLREAFSDFDDKEYSSNELQISYDTCYNNMTQGDDFFSVNRRLAKILLDSAFREFVGRVPSSGEDSMDMECLVTPGAAASIAASANGHSPPAGPSGAQVRAAQVQHCTTTIQYSTTSRVVYDRRQ